MRILTIAALIIGCSLCISCDGTNSVRVVRVEIRYIEWSILTPIAMTCDRLNEVESVSTVTVVDSGSITHLLKAIDKAELSEIPEMDHADARICCVFLDDSGSVAKTISFAPTSIMQIDNGIYETDPSLFELVLSYLPEEYTSEPIGGISDTYGR